MTRLPAEVLVRLREGSAEAFGIAADWLLERGDARGDFARAQQVLTTRVNPAMRGRAKETVRRLEREHRLDWLAPLQALGVQRAVFRRGFVDEVWLAEASLKHLEALLELEPIRRVRVTLESGDALLRAIATPAFRHLDELRVAGGVPRLAAMPTLRRLVLREATPALVASLPELAPALEHLGVAHTPTGTTAMHTVASGALPLKVLWACNADVNDGALRTLAASNAGLEELDLTSTNAAGGLRALGASTTLTKLERLNLANCDASDFLAAQGLPALKKLRVVSMEQQRKLMARRGVRPF